MIDFSVEPRTRMLLDTVRGFVDSELAPLEDEVERSGALAPAHAREIFAKSTALGLYAMNIPADLGGGGLDTVQMCLVEEQAGRTKDILIRRAFGNVYEVLLGVPARHHLPGSPCSSPDLARRHAQLPSSRYARIPATSAKVMVCPPYTLERQSELDNSGSLMRTPRRAGDLPVMQRAHSRVRPP